MKAYKTETGFPELRRYYKSYEDLGHVINRSKSYVNNCLNGRRQFSELENKLLAADMNADVSEIFPEVA